MRKLLSVLLMLVLVSCSVSESESTNNVYLLPTGFEGVVFVFYNIPGENKLKVEGDYKVIPLEQEGLDELNNMGVKQYATHFTSTPDMKYGTVTDKYYYINEESKRTPINKECIYGAGNGIVTKGGREIPFSKLLVTTSNCGRNFHLRGDDSINLLSEIEWYLFDYIDYTY